MIQKATAMKIAIASIMLKGIIETSNYTLANAQSDSATMKEQKIDQKNVCSGWAQCTNNAEDTIDSSDEVGTQALIAIPH